MRSVHVAALCALLTACFSKPGFKGGGNGDGGIDAPTDGPIDGPPIDPSGPARIASGDQHACRLSSGTILCWGSNSNGQLGEYNVTDFSGVPGPVSGDMDWISVATGIQHTCGVRNNAVYCWGENGFRQSDPTASATEPAIPITEVQLPASEIPVRVFAGAFATCALTTTGAAYCWGKINYQPGDALPLTPQRLGGTGATFTQIALASDHGCAIAVGGLVHCWGESEERQTGRADEIDVAFESARPITSTETFVTLASGYETTCGTTNAGKLVCWGSSNHGHLSTKGPSPTSNGFVPFILDDTRTWSAVALGSDHTCAVSEGTVYCWGKALTGALGDGTFDQRLTRDSINVGMQVSQLSANAGHTCALSSDGVTMKCWGSNSKGQVGNKKSSRKYEPTEAQLPAVSVVAQLIAGDDHTCALVGSAAPYTAYCWGRNHRRQIGTSSAVALHALPVQAAAPSMFRKLTAGEKHTCGIVDGGLMIQCWGENAELQLGTSTAVSAITGGATATTGWTALGAGSRMSCGIDGGMLKCWGARPGQANTATPTNYPKVGARDWHSISVGSGFAIGAIMSGTTPYLAGLAGSSRRCAAGLVTADPTDQPAEILAGAVPWTTPPTVSSAQAGGAHSCVLRLAGATPTVSCMGDPSIDAVNGPSLMCGIANTNYVNVAIPAGWRGPDPAAPSMFATGDHTCALDANDELMCWGGNSNSELGTISSGPAPKPVFPGRKWQAIAGGRDHSCGISLTDGKVYCWGENQYGQVGDGSSYEPSPVVSGVP